jgi:alpha-mannosidase/mannosylglycerate hydrolase
VSAARPIQRFVVVPHTHWDREWYRPFEHFRLELARVVDEVLDLLERDQRFSSFTLDGQAIVLEDYLEIRPDNEPRLRHLLRSGRIEVGPSYVLPDEFLVGAEPLVRNLLRGMLVCRRLGAEPSPVGYLPDSFGHPLQLPQLLAGFGIRTMVFSRGLGDELDEVGVVFHWRAPDGSEVLALQQLPAYGNFAFVRDADAGERRVRAIVERFGALLARACIDALLLCNGEDHVPVSPELPSLCDELERRFPGSRFEIASYADYVRLVGDPEVPVHTGELLGSRIQNVLRGVNSARLYIKRANEQAERRLLAVETLGALRSLRDGSPFPGGDFELAWRDLLRCQPHDTICGCSCDEVHRDALARYESLHRTLSALELRSIEAVGGGPVPGGSVGVVNLLPYPRRGVIELAGREPTAVELDGWSARTVELPRTGPARPDRFAGTAIESDRFRVEASPEGRITLTDKRSGRRLSGLHALEDELDAGDLYNFCPVEGDSVWRSDRAAVRVLRNGPLVSELELRVEAERPVGLDRADQETAPLSVRTVIRLAQGSNRAEFRTTVDNTANDHRLRVAFPLGPVDGSVRAEGHFAVIHRRLAPPPPRSAWVEPPDPTQHTLGAVALGPIALFTKGLPEYEARVIDGQAELCLTLLRCVGIISRPDGLATRPRTAGPQLPTPEAQCLGRHHCEYALRLDADRLEDLALLRESQDYRWGLLTAPAQLTFGAPLRVEGDVVFSCLKGAADGDGLILRCFNPAAWPTTVRVVGDVSVGRTRLDETGEQALRDGVAQVRAFEILSLRLRPRGERR